MNTSLLIRAVREVAAKHPNRVYSNDHEGLDCVYRVPETGEPSCLIGHALDRIGYLDLIPASTAIEDGKCRNTMDVISLLNDMAVQLTETQRGWLNEVQSKQDQGIAWGEALKEADNEMGEV